MSFLIVRPPNVPGYLSGENNMWDFQTLTGKAAKEPIMLLDE